jgi:hypothetical protein
VAAVEFAIVATVFFMMVFGIIEIARAMYMFNTLSEVTRNAARAAANISFIDDDALNAARKRAVFSAVKGELPFGSPITYENVRIEYMYLGSKAISLELITAMPSCPARNRLNCMNNPNSSSCIRAVQARICKETAKTGACTPVTFQPIISLIDLPLKLPTSPTIVNAETLGYRTGDTPCP